MIENKSPPPPRPGPLLSFCIAVSMERDVQVNIPLYFQVWEENLSKKVNRNLIKYVTNKTDFDAIDTSKVEYLMGRYSYDVFKTIIL